MNGNSVFIFTIGCKLNRRDGIDYVGLTGTNSQFSANPIDLAGTKCFIKSYKLCGIYRFIDFKIVIGLQKLEHRVICFLRLFQINVGQR